MALGLLGKPLVEMPVVTQGDGYSARFAVLCVMCKTQLGKFSNYQPDHDRFQPRLCSTFSRTDYAVEFKDCGFETTFDKQPSKGVRI